MYSISIPFSFRVGLCTCRDFGAVDPDGITKGEGRNEARLRKRGDDIAMLIVDRVSQIK